MHRLIKETRANVTFDAKLARLAEQIDRVDKRCMRQCELIDDELAGVVVVVVAVLSTKLSNCTCCFERRGGRLIESKQNLQKNSLFFCQSNVASLL